VWLAAGGQTMQTQQLEDVCKYVPKVILLKIKQQLASKIAALTLMRSQIQEFAFQYVQHYIICLNTIKVGPVCISVL